MITAKEIKKQEQGNVRYALFSLTFEGSVRFAICVRSKDDSAMEVVGGTEEQARELFGYVADGELSPEHLFDVAEDYRHAVLPL